MLKVKQDHYFDYDEITQFLELVQKTLPGFTQLQAIGQTLEGRKIWLLSITDLSHGDFAAKPAVWVDANTHAGEVTGAQTCLELISQLAEGARSGEQNILRLLKLTTFYIVPRISADGSEIYLKTGHNVRSTPAAWPPARGRAQWNQKDIDGDGDMLTIRKKDRAGAFKINPHNPLLLTQREPGDNDPDADYYFLYEEGELAHLRSRSHRTESGWGLDLNRNFPFEYRPEGQQLGAGTHALSMPEARALVEAVTERKNIFLVITLHTHGGYWLRPWGAHPDTEMNSNDLAVYKTLGEGVAKQTGYPLLNTFKDFQYIEGEFGSGHFDDWTFGHRGIISYTVELWDVFAQFGQTFKHPTDRYFKLEASIQDKLYRWCKEKLAEKDFFVPWRPFEHPQLGPVEIGGWKPKFVVQNPPLAFLEKEVQKVTSAILHLANSAPQIEISVDVKPIGDATSAAPVFTCKFHFKNSGFFGTAGSEQAKKILVDHLPHFELKLADGQKLMMGDEVGQLPHLNGRQRFLPWHSPQYLVMRDNTHEAELTFLVQGVGTIELKADFFRGGICKHQVRLQ